MRAYGNLANTNIISFVNPATGLVKFNYVERYTVPMTLADPVTGYNGFSEINPGTLLTGLVVRVLDGRTGYIFSAENALSALAVARWTAESTGIVPNSATGPGTFTSFREDKVFEVSLAAAEVATVALSQFAQPGDSISFYRSDLTTGILTLVPVGTDTILDKNGASVTSIQVAPGSTVTLKRDIAGVYKVISRIKAAVVPPFVVAADLGGPPVILPENTKDVVLDFTGGGAATATIEAPAGLEVGDAFSLVRIDVVVASLNDLLFSAYPGAVVIGANIPAPGAPVLIAFLASAGAGAGISQATLRYMGATALSPHTFIVEGSTAA
jgi:hypothetical protein